MGDGTSAGIFLTFLGAARTVTGSKTLVEAGGVRVLVDCGLFQGPGEVRRRNWEPLPLDPSSVHAVLLTHAHLDHCGYLPLLVHDGFTGPIFCTPRTAELAAIVLRDSARLQEEDTAYARKKGYSRHAEPRALYDSADAEAAIALLRPMPFDAEFSPAHGLRARFLPAGHILGASILQIQHGATSVVFSGDLGRPAHPILRAPGPPPPARTIVIESTYGDRAHEELDIAMARMAEAISATIARGGSVLIPAFAVDRTEVLLHALGILQHEGRIPTVPIHVDSPMALAAMRCYLAAIADRDPEIRETGLAVADINLPNLHEARTPQDSMALDHGGGRIIISASGMGAGGRVVHHLKALLPDPANTVLLAGFQSPGTPGRALIDGARELKMHGRYVKVRAEILSIGALSVHADADDLIAWLRSATPQQVLVVHGEPEASRILADRIEAELDIAAAVPEPGERIRA